MHINRRTFFGVAGTAVAATALSACSGTGGAGSADNANSNTIKFWTNHPGQSKRVEQTIINRFQQQNPNLTVQLVDAGKDYEEVATKFNAALTGGELPDVVVLSDVWWFNFALNNQIEPLDSHFAAAGVNSADYVDSLLADYEFDGKHWALPYARSTPLFYYNKEVWAQAGLPDRGPATWQEFDEWGPQIQHVVGPGKLAHGWANAKNYLSWTFEGPMWTFGGAYSDQWTLRLTDDRTIAAGQFLSDTIHVKNYAAVRDSIANDFGAGLIASMVDSTGDLGGVAKNAGFSVGTAFLPAAAGTIGCPTGGTGVAVPSRISDERKLNALKFINFLTDPANTAYFSEQVGYLPVRKAALADAGEQSFLARQPAFSTAVQQLPHTKSQDYARVFLPGGEKAIGTALERICLQNADVKSTFADLSARLQQITDRQITPKLPK